MQFIILRSYIVIWLYSTKPYTQLHCKCVVDEISMSVDPPGQLMRGMTITISCEVRYQGRETLSSEQDPDLTLTFANEQDLPTGITYYHQPSSDGAFQRKTLVRVSADFRQMLLYICCCKSFCFTRSQIHLTVLFQFDVADMSEHNNTEFSIMNHVAVPLQDVFQNGTVCLSFCPSRSYP